MAHKPQATYEARVVIRSTDEPDEFFPTPPTDARLAKLIEDALVAESDYQPEEVSVTVTRTDK